MRRFRSSILSFTILLAGASVPSHLMAQGGPIVEVSYAKQIEAMGVGAGYGFALGEMTTQTGIWGQAMVDFFFPKKFHQEAPVNKDLSQSYYEMNMNFIKVVGAVPGLFIGSGLNYSTRRIDSGNYGGEEEGANLGVSVMGGFHFGPLKQAPFVQARYEFGGGKQFIVSAGLAF